MVDSASVQFLPSECQSLMSTWYVHSNHDASRGFPDTPGAEKVHIRGGETQHVGALLADHFFASLAPCALEIFVIQLFGAATLGIEEKEASG